MPSSTPTRLRKSSQRLARRVSLWLREQRWRRAHPGQDGADYYVHRFAERIERPGSHSNIGNVSNRPEYTRAFGAEVLRLLRELGMRPGHTCVEYGCGSLHVGEPLIEYLAPGGYVGLDVTDLFFRDATQRFDPQWLAEKRPRLERIGPEVREALRAQPPDFLVCTHVLILVPPRELPHFVRALTSLMGPNTRCLLELELRSRTRRVTETFFWHGREQIARVFEREGFELRTLATFPPLRRGMRDSTFAELVRRA